jgi:uncharacterized membrane protein (DUF4010 family)
MFQLSVPLKLIISLILGAVIGLERESYEKEISKPHDIPAGGLGVRTFALITLLGAVAGLLRPNFFSLFLTLNISFMLLTLSYYIIGSIFTNDNGITTELGIIFAYLVGLFISLEVFSVQIILALTVVLILILSRKAEIKTIIKGIKRSEINAFISYAIIALVVLPFLPNQSFILSDIPNLEEILSSYNINLGILKNIEILNPSRLWMIVALITGVDVAGYILEKTVGQKKGWLLTSMAGGFISSTATTQSLAQQSKKSANTNALVAAAIFANLTSFIQMFILIALINSLFLVRSTIFILSIILSSFAAGIFFLQKKEKIDLKKTKESLKQVKIFALGPALKFALLFSLIKLASKLSLVFFGQNGFLAATALGSLAGLDAIIINTSELAANTITFKTGILALILANAINLLSKVVYSFTQGKKDFAIKFGLSMLAVIASSFIGLLV